MVEIIPTVLAYNIREFRRRFKKVVSLSRVVQIDFMDGRFVKTKSIRAEQVPNVRKYENKLFEAHLMVKEPMPWVPELARKGFRRIIFHYESVFPEDLPLIARFLKTMKVTGVLAINPETPVAKIAPYTKLFEAILFLGVQPGENGAPYIQSTPARIKALKKRQPKCIVQVDGGMTPATIAGVVRAGATRINSGSYVSSARDPQKALDELRRAAGEQK